MRPISLLSSCILTCSSAAHLQLSVLVWLGSSLQRISGQSLGCDIPNDTCNSTFNGVCDSILGGNPTPSCETGDCFDCNLCSEQFSYDCEGCLNAEGCVWCPGDGTCFNSADAHSWYGEGFFPSCTAAEDYLSGISGGTCAAVDNVFTDPLYSAEKWVFDLINIEPVWQQAIFGTGVRVRINDSGMDNTHPEFEGRFDESASCTVFAPEPDAIINHGTAVASIVAAGANNLDCSVGVAPQANLSSCNILEYPIDSGRYAFLVEKVDSFDISQNSFGLFACEDDFLTLRRQNRKLQVCPFRFEDPRISARPCEACDFNDFSLTDQCEEAIVTHCAFAYENDVAACLDFLDLLLRGRRCDYDKFPPSAIDALTTGITEGRDGKGIIYVFASGNSYAQGDDVNFGALTNSRFTITVGSVGKDGKHSSYSTPGAALVVSAPGGDREFISNHVGAQHGGGCGMLGSGTSFACPVVSGVVALMLEVNPNLTWRDVQGILAATSTMVFDDDDDDTRITNAAGFNHSNFYGFGIVNAEKAVAAAQTWRLFEKEELRIAEALNLNLPIEDSSSTVTTVNMDLNDEEFITESVVVLLDLQHFSRGDLEIVLTSPQGTRSILHPGARPENSQLDADERWKLMTVRNWGENPAGTWNLGLRDIRAGDLTDCIDEAFYTVFEGIEVTCRYLEQEEFCVDSTVDNGPTKFGDVDFQPLLDVTSNGVTLQEACCSCGGGIETTEFDDVLRQWRLVVYGHVFNGNTTMPTLGPSEIPSTLPTPISSMNPSPPPTKKPTPAPVLPRAPVEPPNVNEGKSPEERNQLIVNIAASAAVFILVACCCYAALKPQQRPDYSVPGGGKDSAVSAEMNVSAELT